MGEAKPQRPQEREQERTRKRLIGGITLSGEHYLRAELDQEKKRTRNLLMALVGVIAMFVLALVAARYAYVQSEIVRKNAEDQRELLALMKKHTCDEVKKITSILSKTKDDLKWDESLIEFRLLYRGPMIVLEHFQNFIQQTSGYGNSPIERQMVSFGRALGLKNYDKRLPEDKDRPKRSDIDQTILIPIAKHVAIECDKFAPIDK